MQWSMNSPILELQGDNWGVQKSFCWGGGCSWGAAEGIAAPLALMGGVGSPLLSPLPFLGGFLLGKTETCQERSVRAS